MKKTALFFMIMFVSFLCGCGDDPNPIRPTEPDNELTDNDSDVVEIDNEVKDDSNTDSTPENNCADTNGLSCTTDSDCGNCMICITGGKCAKGCMSDEDCTMAVGLKCNKKLNRCLNVFATNKACSEDKCNGCCYTEKGLSELKCSTTQSPAVCGLCPNGEIYSAEDSKCISAVCSTTTDNCPSLNSGSTKPQPKCFECQSGELICKAKTTTSGCSAGVVINAAQCIPAGQNCIDSISECCSGMPCVEGYCY